jgi:hypothetical protein
MNINTFIFMEMDMDMVMDMAMVMDMDMGMDKEGIRNMALDMKKFSFQIYIKTGTHCGKEEPECCLHQ